MSKKNTQAWAKILRSLPLGRLTYGEMCKFSLAVILIEHLTNITLLHRVLPGTASILCSRTKDNGWNMTPL